MSKTRKTGSKQRDGSSFQGYSYYLAYQVKRSLELSENPEMAFPVFPVVSISGNPVTAIVFIESL